MGGRSVDGLLRRLGTRRSANENESARPLEAASASLGRFEAMAAGSARERFSAPNLARRGSTLPAGFRCEDFLGIGFDGFVPIGEGAEQMGLSVAEVERLASAGWLEARERGGELHVRPAIVSILRVDDRRER